jgi:hypothetical protein
MKRNLTKPKDFVVSFFLFAVILSFNIGYSQELYIGSGGEFFLKNNTLFTTGNTVVTHDSSGKFMVEAGSDWGSVTEYVNGKVEAIGTGDTKLPTGDNGVYAPVVASHTGNMTATYFNATPTSGSNGADVDAVSNVEYWEMTGNAVVTLPWNDHSDITSLVNNNGGKLESVAIVGLNGGVWDLVSATQTNTVTGDLQNGTTTSDVNVSVNLNGFTEFTFGIDHQVVLKVENLFLNNSINIISNPVSSSDEFIRFVTKDEMKGLELSLFDMSGRKIRSFKNITTFGNVGSVVKPNLKSGVYLIKFEHEGKQGVKKIIIK